MHKIIIYDEISILDEVKDFLPKITERYYIHAGDPPTP
jgi:hypothetical protein